VRGAATISTAIAVALVALWGIAVALGGEEADPPELPNYIVVSCPDGDVTGNGICSANDGIALLQNCFFNPEWECGVDSTPEATWTRSATPSPSFTATTEPSTTPTVESTPPVPPSSSTPPASPSLTPTLTAASTATPSAVPTFTPTPTSPPSASRSKLLQPFSSTSPWNYPIGSGAQYVDAQISGGIWAVENGMPILAPNAPMRALRNNGDWWPDAACNASGSSQNVPIPDGYVVPAPPSGGDGTLPNRTGGVLLADGATIVEFQYATRCQSTGPLTVGAVRCSHSVYGSGLCGFAAHGGSGLSGVGGVLRVHELTGAIQHALKLTIGVEEMSSCNGGFRWPAVAADTGFNDGGDHQYSGGVCAMRMGSLLALQPSYDCGQHAGLAGRVCQALKDYGMYVVDAGPQGWNVRAIIGEYGTASALGSVEDDFEEMWAELFVVNNNSAAMPGGGGVPRVPLAPAIGD